MKRTFLIYAALLALVAGTMLVSTQWGGFMLLLVLMTWFLHSVFASTDGSERL